MVVIIVADLCLWISLFYFITIATIGRAAKVRRLVLLPFLVLAALGTLYQLAGVLGISVTYGALVTFVLANMAAVLMYAVWIPSALVFFASALRSTNPRLRLRFLLLAVGLLLITGSWAWRLTSVDPPIVYIMVASVLGFIGLLAGVVSSPKPQVRAL